MDNQHNKPLSLQFITRKYKLWTIISLFLAIISLCMLLILIFKGSAIYSLLSENGIPVFIPQVCAILLIAIAVLIHFRTINSFKHQLEKIQYVAELTKLQQEKNELNEQLFDLRLRTAASQMQPHFLYNSLASIREIVLEDPPYASDLICDFTTHLRACIHSMFDNDTIPFSEELENIKAYVNIEHMRFGSKLKVIYEIGPSDFNVVSLGIQPFVENAIRHGIYPKGRLGGTVIVRTEKNDSGVAVTVTDDGVGFDVQQLQADIDSGKKDSVGLKNSIFRFDKLQKATVTVVSTPGTGTTVSVHIPTKI